MEPGYRHSTLMVRSAPPTTPRLLATTTASMA